MSRIKIGQIGVGHAHAKGKMEVFRRLSDDYEVIGVVEPDSALREAAARDGVYRDLPWMSQEELLNSPGLQAVIVETEVAQLLGAAEASIAAGMHIHLDKPAGASLTQFQRILDQAAAKHLLVQMGYMYRYNPAVVLLHRCLAEGWLGEVFELHAVMSKQVSPQSRLPYAQFVGGTMFELGCHLVDLAVGVLGKPDRVTPYLRHSASIDDGMMDNMLAVFEYPKAIATLKSTALEVDGFDRRHLVVCGSEGTLHIQPLDRPDVVLSLSRACGEYKKGTQAIAFGDYPRYLEDARDMARVIRGEKDAAWSYEHDLAVQETVLQASGMPLK